MPPAELSLAPPEAWQYGVVGVIAFTFGIAIIYLFKLYIKRIDRSEKALRESETERTKERGEALARDTEIRASFEERFRELSDSYAQKLEEHYEDSRSREDIVRKDFADMIEGMAKQASESSAEVVRVLDKIYERFIGPRRRY